MRYSASEKFEIIELVEQSSISIRRTLAPIGIPRSTFYGWYSRYQEGGIEALEDGKPRPRRIWNKIPDEIGTAIVNLALEEPDLSPRELAVNFTDTKGSFVSEASVYRLLKDHGLITSPAFILMKAADRQWETDPPGTLNLTHRIRWFLREGGADAEGGGADGIGGFEEARGEHPGSVAVDGTVAQHGSAVFARWRCGGQA